MKESEIRSRAAHDRYLELVRRDAEKLAEDAATFEPVPCPVCGGEDEGESFVKLGFRYVACRGCDTLFVSPRPPYVELAKIYQDSESTRFWVEEFFTPMIEPRREKIFRPRARFLAERFPEMAAGRIGDVGAGFGLFLEELRPFWPEAELIAIEPSEAMARICRQKGLSVVDAMLEDVDAEEGRFDVLTAFELFEHLHDPLGFLERARALLRPGGLLVMTTLSGLGFDIQFLWQRSRSVSPPHHLNFANPFTIGRLLERADLEVVDVATPGALDWDILQSTLDEEEPGPDLRFWRTVQQYGSREAKGALQSWIHDHGFSSHMRLVARAR